MSNQRFSPEFKDEAVRQIVDRGYSVPEVSERLGVSAHSLYKSVKAVKPDKTDEQAEPVVARTNVEALPLVIGSLARGCQMLVSPRMRQIAAPDDHCLLSTSESWRPNPREGYQCVSMHFAPR